MKKILLLCLLTYFSSAQAALVGDTVHVAHNWSSLGSEIYSPRDVLVVNGNSDLAAVSPFYNVDIDDTSVYVDYVGATSWSLGSFNGLVISQIDSLLENFIINTNFVGWDSTRFSYADNSLRMNWNGLSFTADTYFELNFNGENLSEVPLPAALFMFAPALLGLMGFRRKNKNSVA